MTYELLKKNINALIKQSDWLEYSCSVCNNIGLKDEYTRDEFDKFETLCSRFARSIDLLVRKVFRSIDDVEFEIPGTLIDVVNNAHKRNLFDPIEELREIQNLRNDISHEYIDEGLAEMFADALRLTPVLKSICDNTIKYCEKYIKEVE